VPPPAPAGAPIDAARRLLLVHSHPDDESIMTGGTIARYAADPDTHVTLVTCTLGEEGEVMRPELAGLVADRADQLGGYRVAELADACAALGLVDQRYLGGLGRWRDSGMVEGHGVLASAPPADKLHPRAFAAESARAEQVAALAAILDEVRPQVVVCYDPDGGYGHPDHVRAHEIAMEAAADAESVRKVYWTVAPEFDVTAGLAELRGAAGLPWRVAQDDELACVPDGTVTARLDVAAQLPAKLAALRAHATQLTVWHDGPHAAFALTNEIAQPVLAAECYTLVGAARSVLGQQTETDLFEGIETGLEAGIETGIEEAP
jgi:N-acetyl-1-D-myo-inositol-2-amino-2-deoxy-alpha-D-glucopyranoside deacetylase